MPDDGEIKNLKEYNKQLRKALMTLVAQGLKECVLEGTVPVDFDNNHSHKQAFREIHAYILKTMTDVSEGVTSGWCDTCGGDFLPDFVPNPSDKRFLFLEHADLSDKDGPPLKNHGERCIGYRKGWDEFVRCATTITVMTSLVYLHPACEHLQQHLALSPRCLMCHRQELVNRNCD